MNMKDLQVEPIKRKQAGMQPVTSEDDIRVTHLPSGIVIEIPHGFETSQARNLKAAIKMLETVITNA